MIFDSLHNLHLYLHALRRNLLILLCDCMMQEPDHVFIKRQTLIQPTKNAELLQ